MTKVKRITANIPFDLLESASKVTGKGITETIVQGLKLVKRSSAFEKGQALKGKLDLIINLDMSRERTRR